MFSATAAVRLLLLSVFALRLPAQPAATSTAGAGPLPAKVVAQRVNSLLRRMTLDEKIGQLNQLFYGLPLPDPGKPEEEIENGQVGSLLFVTDPVKVNRLQHLAVDKTRLHIPLLFGYDVIHGFHTMFPVPLAMAASWDPALVERAQSIAAREAYAAGVRWAFAPMVDIARDPRWGRIVEGAGEDPYLGAAIAKAQVRGLQGPYLGSPDRLLACVKHFAGYGAADGGRDYDSSYIPESLLRNVYLKPFHAAVEAGVGSLMSAYMDLNDVPATANSFLLKTILRDEWKFQGFVVSDAFAVRDLATHGFAANPSDAAIRAFAAGVDMDMGSRTYVANLRQLVERHRVPVAAIDHAVSLILSAKLRLGLFEQPYADEAAGHRMDAIPDHRETARVAAERSAVLLRNERRLLPLDTHNAKFSSIAVLGPLADSQADIQGSWSMSGDRKRAVTILQGLREKLSPSTRVEYARAGEIKRGIPSMFEALFPAPKSPPLTDSEIESEMNQAVDLARRCDLTILVLGESQDMSGEAASRSSLDLPGQQRQLLERVVALGKPVVLVLINGRPLNLVWAAEHVPAILEAWHPGDEGGHAIANLLVGDVTPGGKLPVSWPRDAGQIPVYYAHNLTHQPETGKNFKSRYWNISTSPLYPFGFGLSYTTFAFSNLRVSAKSIPAGGSLEASAEVANTGNRPGDEVAQLYLHQQAGSASRPVRELKGFERISLSPGQTKSVHFRLGREELAFWSAREKGWVVEPGAFDIWIGSDSTASLHANFEVQPAGPSHTNVK